MATWDDVRRLALAMPETTERPAWGSSAWRVTDRLFVWERPLRSRDRDELGDSAPDGPIVAVYVSDLGEKEALLAGAPSVYFTVGHLDGYAIVLGRLDRVPVDELEELVVDSWCLKAPKHLLAAYRAGRS
ncbi:MmcQ/YjbR family DNA-binding protein [Sanguibacter sp. 25GB23B1]|uniref:MmcQ/YjbR family DNA-binding protein n=1 Tax=unclassified Sanguibacter TaxID=2645534 RepID=UPI0032AF060E